MKLKYWSWYRYSAIGRLSGINSLLGQLLQNEFFLEEEIADIKDAKLLISKVLLNSKENHKKLKEEINETRKA